MHMYVYVVKNVQCFGHDSYKCVAFMSVKNLKRGSRKKFFSQRQNIV